MLMGLLLTKLRSYELPVFVANMYTLCRKRPSFRMGTSAVFYPQRLIFVDA